MQSFPLAGMLLARVVNSAGGSEPARGLGAYHYPGATGSMTGSGFPDGLHPILDAWRAGDREAATRHYERWLPLINIENRQCGLLAAKALMHEGGIIACEAPRHPLPSLHPASRSMLIETARRLDALVLRWHA